MEKDYLTTKEAAHFFGVSIRKFYYIKKAADLRPIETFGKNLYKRSDLLYILEHAKDYQARLYV